MTVRFFLLQNRQGKTRLSKWYVAAEDSDKRKIESEVHRLVTTRDAKFTNFVEVRCRARGAVPRASKPSLPVPLPPPLPPPLSLTRPPPGPLPRCASPPAVPEHVQDHLQALRGALLLAVRGRVGQ